MITAVSKYDHINKLRVKKRLILTVSLFFSTPPGSDAKHPDNSARSSAPGKLSQPIKALSAYLETLRTELQVNTVVTHNFDRSCFSNFLNVFS